MNLDDTTKQRLWALAQKWGIQYPTKTANEYYSDLCNQEIAKLWTQAQAEAASHPSIDAITRYHALVTEADKQTQTSTQPPLTPAGKKEYCFSS
jgi:hypothetical protein